jgi:DNA-binding XRE family transcriptional regulator
MSKNMTYIAWEKSWRKYTGTTLKEFRQHFGVSQAELATILGVSRATIVNIESRINASELSTIWKIAMREIFNRPYDYFPSIDGRLLDPAQLEGGPKNAK